MSGRRDISYMLNSAQVALLNGPGYWTYTFSTNRIEADARAAALYGMAPNSEDGVWRGEPQQFISAILEEDRPYANSSGLSVRRDAAGALNRSRPFRIEVEGAIQWRRYTSYFAFGDTDRAFGMVEDCTEEMVLQGRIAQLEQAGAESERLENSARMAAPMAHDMANLLTVLLPTLTLVRDEFDAQSDLSDLMDSALHAGRSIAHLSRQLVTLVRGTAPARSVDVVAEIDASRRLLERSLPASITLEVSLPDEPVYAWFPPGAITQCVVNLVLNSRDAMADRVGRITIAVHSAAEEVVISVRDNGPGIPEPLRRELGRAFRSTKGERGTGLGLYMVRTLAENHGGQFAIISSESKETEVSFSARRVAPSQVGQRRGGSVDLRRVTVVVYEQDAAVRRLLVHVLRSAQAAVHECPTLEAFGFVVSQLPTGSVCVVGDTFTDPADSPMAVIASARKAGITRFVWIGNDVDEIDDSSMVIGKPFEVMPLLSAVYDLSIR